MLMVIAVLLFATYESRVTGRVLDLASATFALTDLNAR